MNMLGQRQAVHFGHVDVGETAVHVFRGQNAHRLASVAGREDVIALELEVLAGDIQDVLFVVDKEQRFFFSFRIHANNVRITASYGGI